MTIEAEIAECHASMARHQGGRVARENGGEEAVHLRLESEVGIRAESSDVEDGLGEHERSKHCPAEKEIAPAPAWDVLIGSHELRSSDRG